MTDADQLLAVATARRQVFESAYDEVRKAADADFFVRATAIEIAGKALHSYVNAVDAATAAIIRKHHALVVIPGGRA
jgi:hypothetical protein